jgi:DNA-3-methyladenine glycosylase II
MAPKDPYARARQHLRRNDPVMKRLIDRVGSCTLQTGGDLFEIMVRSIVSQLLSTSAARTIFARLQLALGDGGLAPTAILDLDEDAMRKCGLSGAKTTAIRQLASHISAGDLDLYQLEKETDEAVAERLLQLHGVGPWTVQMFLIFGLGRLNILPVGDMGVRAAVRELYALEELPTAPRLREMGKAWLPYCTVAAWYLWRSRGWAPQS